MHIQHVQYKPGTDLADRIKVETVDADLVFVQIPRRDPSDPAELALKVEQAEQETGIEVWVNGTFDMFKHPADIS